MICAVFWCIIWNNLYFVGIYLFSLDQHTALINRTIRQQSIYSTPTQYVLTFYSHYCYCELSILLLFMLSKYTPAEVHLLLFYIGLRQLFYSIILYIKISLETFLTNIKTVLLWYFRKNHFSAVKEINKHWFSINKNKCRNKITVPQTNISLKDRALSGVRWL